MIDTRDAENALLADAVHSAPKRKGRTRVLEAGCGKRWVLTPHDDVHVTGLDRDVGALRIRREAHGDLDEEIVADLRHVVLPVEAYDVVYCSFVLEHVAGAEAVLDGFVSALRPGGRLIIRVPDGTSVYGFVTKRTPHFTHVLYKRYVEHNKNAGKPGYAPYPTVYDEVVTLQGLRDWAERRGLTVLDEYGTNFYLRHFGQVRPAVSSGLRAFAALSRGKLSASHNNIGLIIEKPA